MDIQQPPRGAELNSTEMQRFLQDAYNSIKNPNCKVYFIGNTPMTSGFTIAAFDGVEYNNLDGWDRTNHRFNPKVPGYYFYTFRCHFQMYQNSSLGAPIYAMVARSLSGAAAASHCEDRYYVGSGTGLYNIYTLNCYGLAYLNGMNDYLDCRTANAMVTPPGDVVMVGGADHTAFTAHKISY